MYQVEIAGKSIQLESKEGIIYIDGKASDADIVSTGNKHLSILVNNKPVEAELISIDKSNKSVVMMINNRKHEVTLKDSFDLLLHDLGMDNLAAKKINDIKAPMPGLVLKVLVEDGQAVKKGENILVLEAMKMENMLKAADDCVIRKINISAGDKVEKGQVLIQL